MMPSRTAVTTSATMPVTVSAGTVSPPAAMDFPSIVAAGVRRPHRQHICSQEC
jgi:hypothetical protein